ncbi:hypothetical protein LXL04_001888 [Taraxacum kok-saghyz]
MYAPSDITWLEGTRYAKIDIACCPKNSDQKLLASLRDMHIGGSMCRGRRQLTPMAERMNLARQLDFYIDVVKDDDRFSNLSGITELSKVMERCKGDDQI